MKPGSEHVKELARLSRQAKIIQRSVPDELREKMLVKAETQLGLRCGGCFERITIGFLFRSIEVATGDDGKPLIDVAKISACNGANGCDFADQARQGATLVEMVEYAWLDGAFDGAGLEQVPDAEAPPS